MHSMMLDILYKDYAFLNAPFPWSQQAQLRRLKWSKDTDTSESSNDAVLATSFNQFFFSNPISFLLKMRRPKNCRWTVKHSGFKKIEIQTFVRPARFSFTVTLGEHGFEWFQIWLDGHLLKESAASKKADVEMNRVLSVMQIMILIMHHWWKIFVTPN